MRWCFTRFTYREIGWKVAQNSEFNAELRARVSQNIESLANVQQAEQVPGERSTALEQLNSISVDALRSHALLILNMPFSAQPLIAPPRIAPFGAKPARAGVPACLPATAAAVHVVRHRSLPFWFHWLDVLHA